MTKNKSITNYFNTCLGSDSEIRFKIGIDLVSEERVFCIWSKYKEKFLNKFCSKNEKIYILNLISKNASRSGRIIASFFATKESVAKCLKINPFDIGFKSIYLKKTDGKFANVFVNSQSLKNFDISVTHSIGQCIVVCVIF